MLGTVSTRAIDDQRIERAVEQIQAGRRVEEGFRVLHAAYFEPLQRFFSKHLGSTDASLDLTQETFLRIYRNVDGFRGDAPFGAWVYRIAWNELRRHTSRGSPVHRPGRQTSLEESETKPPGPQDPDPMHRERETSPYGEALRRERLEILRRAIGELPPQRRRCLVLWTYQGRTYEEIARAMRLSLGTVKAHIAQARKQLTGLVAQKTNEIR